MTNLSAFHKNQPEGCAKGSLVGKVVALGGTGTQWAWGGTQKTCFKPKLVGLRSCRLEEEGQDHDGIRGTSLLISTESSLSYPPGFYRPCTTWGEEKPKLVLILHLSTPVGA